MRRSILFSLILLLSGCATIPNHSAVQVLDNATLPSTNDSVRVIAKPPVAGMTINQTVEGFLAANSSADNRFSVAREYLTPSAERDWQPNEVWLYEPTTLRITQIYSDTAQVDLELIGELPDNSRLTLYDSSQGERLRVSVVMTSSGWRISTPPKVALMSVADFERNFQAAKLWFLSAAYDHLVPDVVWVPAGSASTSTRVMRLLLEGPAGPLADAVRTAIPTGTELVGVVEAVAGVKQVSLTETALKTDTARRIAMLAQIVQTLVPDSGSVTVEAGGQQLGQQGAGELTPANFTSLAPEASSIAAPLFLVEAGELLRGTTAVRSRVTQLPTASGISVSVTGERLALLTANSVEIRDTVTWEVVQRIQGRWRDLEFDSSGRLWLVNQSGFIKVLSSDYVNQTMIQVPGKTPLALSVGPSGTRVAIVTTSASGVQLRIYPIVAGGKGFLLGSPIRFERSFSDILDVDWLGVDQLIVAARIGVESTQVYSVSMVSLRPRLIAGLSDVEQVMALSGSPICAVTVSSQLWCYGDAGWKLVTAVSSATYAD